jgi:hypothetical protein
MLVATIHRVVNTYGIKPKDVANAIPTKCAGESTGTEHDNGRGRQQHGVYSPRQN